MVTNVNFFFFSSYATRMCASDLNITKYIFKSDITIYYRDLNETVSKLT